MSDNKKTDVVLDCFNCAHYFECKPDCVGWNMFEPHPDLFKEESIVTEETGALATQVGGGHYKDMAIQPMEYSMANNFNACQHTAIKYISRYKDKNGLEDLIKAKHTIDLLIELEYKVEGE